MEQEPKIEPTDKYFEGYEVQLEDLNLLLENADNLTESELLDEITMRDLRIVSFDSKNFYVLTQGEHRSTDQYKVQELPTNSKKGWRIYKINHLL